ncbi:site-specific integrase [Pseudomonas sp. NFR16]|uniref:site-specific integrase n=1 Tax=Pseudomonas sp. NFR16 TaxID=1566248 RepID=UPI0008CE19EB|nr:site-specific integrase [Pseudomonas sp. NFR16]SEJ95623.1 Phage integrase family protein [Pseudomonas sp. NFR16]
MTVADVDADGAEDDGFDQLMEEIDREAREAARAHFDDLYATSHAHSKAASEYLDETNAEDSEDGLLHASDYDTAPVGGQRKGGLKFKLAASPNGDFPISIYSNYNEARWLLKKGGEFSDVAILIGNAREDLQPLKRAISYYFLPSTNPFGTIRSFVSSQNYADSMKYVQHYVFEENKLDGSESSISVISADMLNQALDDAKMLGSPHAYNMLFFYLNFWLALSSQKMIPDGLCLGVETSAIDTEARRKDIIDSINSSFVGWKPYSEEELVALLDYAFFWIDKAVPVIENIQKYLVSVPSNQRGNYDCKQRDGQFEAALNEAADEVVIVGFKMSTNTHRQKAQTSDKVWEYRWYQYSWRLKYQYAIDKVRNAVLILFCLMTGMRRKELAPLKFDDVKRGGDGVWRVFFARYKTSSDPNYAGDADHITIPEYLGQAIESFKKLREFDNNYLKGYLFQPAIATREVNRTNRMISKAVRAVALETGVPRLHIHRFRKTIAELLINESEANIDVIRMIFGHSSYIMTLRYIARNPFLVASVVDTLKEHFAEDFVEVVRAIHTGVYAGDAAHRIANQMHKRPELFSGKVLKTTVMQYVKHLFEGGSSFHIQRTSLGTICMTQTFHEHDQLPPCLISNSELIFPVKPDISRCQIHCEKNIILQGSKDAILHNLKFYRTLLSNGTNLKAQALRELQDKVAANERLLQELLDSAAMHPDQVAKHADEVVQDRS